MAVLPGRRLPIWTTKVKALLTSLGKVPHTHNVEKHVHLTHDCGLFTSCNITYLKKETDQVSLTASKITLAPKGEPTFGTRTTTPLTDQRNWSVWAQQYMNCSDATGSLAIAISKQITHTVTGTVTKQYELTEGGSLGLSGGIPGFATINGSLTISASEMVS